MRIAISPGHQPKFQGVCKNGFMEHSEVNRIAEHLFAKLTDKGHYVDVVRGTLMEKVNLINSINPDFAIEIHLGNANISTVSGSRTFYNNSNPVSKCLSELLLEGMVRTLRTRNAGNWVGWYKRISPSLIKMGKAPSDWKCKIDLFLSKLDCPSCIVEPIFISSIKDTEQFLVSERHEFIAESILNGVQLYADTISIADCVVDAVMESTAA